MKIFCCLHRAQRQTWNFIYQDKNPSGEIFHGINGANPNADPPSTEARAGMSIQEGLQALSKLYDRTAFEQHLNKLGAKRVGTIPEILNTIDVDPARISEPSRKYLQSLLDKGYDTAACGEIDNDQNREGFTINLYKSDDPSSLVRFSTWLNELQIVDAPESAQPPVERKDNPPNDEEKRELSPEIEQLKNSVIEWSFNREDRAAQQRIVEDIGRVIVATDTPNEHRIYMFRAGIRACLNTAEIEDPEQRKSIGRNFFQLSVEKGFLSQEELNEVDKYVDDWLTAK